MIEFNLIFLAFFVFQLFIIGFFGLVSTQPNILFMLLSIEIMFLASNLNFVLFSTFFGSPEGQVIALFVLVAIAAESAVGLALLILFYKLRGTLAYSFTSLLKN